MHGSNCSLIADHGLWHSARCYCGVLCFKLSFGAVSKARMMKLAPELDTVGWFANVPEDLELVCECLQQRQADHLKVSSITSYCTLYSFI
jgi:Asp-tRNA(Asn)/Glu-tRNA(Gln) amidotransferase A subunit family amidase